jgi:hypothetical protein
MVAPPRRWPTKAAIAMDIFEREGVAAATISDAGSVRDLLVEVMRTRLRAWRTPFFHQVALPGGAPSRGNRSRRAA